MAAENLVALALFGVGVLVMASTALQAWRWKRSQPQASDPDKEALPPSWRLCACGYARPVTLTACPACCEGDHA
jgi:hypothetical protein